MSKLPEAIVIKILRKKLAMNICRNRGYILDGYPKGYKNAFNLFNEDTDEAKTPDDPTKYKILEEIMPNIIIRIDNCDDAFIKERMKKLKDVNGDPNVIQRRLDRRLKAYKELFDNEIEIVEKENVNKNVDAHKSSREKELMENEYYDIEKSNVKKQYNEGKSSELEKQEKDLLEKKSEVLRRYLAENVIPVLSKGILHICKTLPEDPVDELAYYLFDNAFNAKFPPHKYKDQK